jgi:hypothetical protein
MSASLCPACGEPLDVQRPVIAPSAEVENVVPDLGALPLDCVILFCTREQSLTFAAESALR